MNGAEALAVALRAAGISRVFGLPGSQNVVLFEALRTAEIRTTVATHELSAAMMANGYYRASGRMAALVTIPGPGFTFSLTGLAEAFLDSAALVAITGSPATAPGRRFQLQAIDQTTMAGPVCKAQYRIATRDAIASTLATACADALAGEPGPVRVELPQDLLAAPADAEFPPAEASPATGVPDATAMAAVAHRVVAANRIVLMLGQGAQGAGPWLPALVERLGAAVVATTSGRGALPEDHPNSLAFEIGDSRSRELNALIDGCDLVLALGCKFSHNGARGFDLRVPPEKLAHVDASAAIPGANYPAHLSMAADSAAFVRALLDALGETRPGAAYGADELGRLRERARSAALEGLIEPRIEGAPGGNPSGFFAALRRVLPRDACLVTDSGAHQAMARRHFRVLAPRGLVTPTNFQSMAFGIGAATGAALATPSRTVVALIGDGGLAMSGLELLTAVRERLRLVVIVFADGAYGLIRSQQLAASGHAFGTVLPPLDIAALADAVGAGYLRVDGDAEKTLAEALGRDGVTLVEVAVGDSASMHWMRAKSLARGALGARTRGWLTALRRRVRRAVGA